MALILGHELPANGNANFDNNPLNKIIYDGVTVWERIVFTAKEFEYTGGEQGVAVPSGLYKLEVWGAEGGSSSIVNAHPGKGGYSCLYYYFSSETMLYVNVGEKGRPADADYKSGKAYNGGGGGAKRMSGGGGATHIAKLSGVLETLETSKSVVLVVAGGGGGVGNTGAVGSSMKMGGDGGGLTGSDSGNGDIIQTNAAGGGQTGTDRNKFGKGYTCYDNTSTTAYAHVAGGGGGWYGGAGSFNGGGGGSGYIGIAHLDGGYYTTHNNVKYENATIAGQRAGNGFAKITRIAD